MLVSLELCVCCHITTTLRLRNITKTRTERKCTWHNKDRGIETMLERWLVIKSMNSFLNLFTNLIDQNIVTATPIMLLTYTLHSYIQRFRYTLCTNKLQETELSQQRSNWRNISLWPTSMSEYTRGTLLGYSLPITPNYRRGSIFQNKGWGQKNCAPLKISEDQGIEEEQAKQKSEKWYDQQALDGNLHGIKCLPGLQRLAKIKLIMQWWPGRHRRHRCTLKA